MKVRIILFYKIKALILMILNSKTKTVVSQPNSDRENRDHLGDGVYVFYSGYDYQISVNDHKNHPVVFMDENIIDRLVQFKERMILKHKILNK